MGKIKSKIIKRTAHTFMKKGIEFSESFDKNKKILKGIMPSKKVRNQLAGFLSTFKKQERENQPKILKGK